MKAMKAHWQFGLGALAALIASHAVAAEYVYPSQGQDKARQTKDEAECSSWAVQQTGFDPSKAAAAPQAAGAATGLGGSVATAAAGFIPGGANLGSVAGLVSGVSGQGLSPTAIASAAGAIPGIGGHATEISQAIGLTGQTTSQQPQQAKPGQADYDQARAACLSGRGYSVR
jgi:hypothetical protein